MRAILILTLCLCGCVGDAPLPPSPQEEGGGMELEARAAWAFSYANLYGEEGTEAEAVPVPGREEDPSPSDRGFKVAPDKPQFCVYAPRWDARSHGILDWLETLDQSSLSFQIVLIPDNDIAKVKVGELVPVILTPDGKSIVTFQQLQELVIQDGQEEGP